MCVNVHMCALPPDPDNSTQLNIEFEGSKGYVYSVKYHDGLVRLSVGSHAVDGSGDGETRGGRLSVKDWKLLCSVVFTDLDQPGFPEVLNVSRWVSATCLELTVVFFMTMSKADEIQKAV